MKSQVEAKRAVYDCRKGDQDEHIGVSTNRESGEGIEERVKSGRSSLFLLISPFNHLLHYIIVRHLDLVNREILHPKAAIVLSNSQNGTFH